MAEDKGAGAAQGAASSAGDDRSKSVPRVKVKLKERHRHGGKWREVGETISVTEKQRDALSDRKII